MKAIFTKVLEQTNTLPHRIKAKDVDGNSVTLSADAIHTGAGLAQYETHLVAANELKRKMGWRGKLAGGGSKDGFVFVFVT